MLDQNGCTVVPVTMSHSERPSLLCVQVMIAFIKWIILITQITLFRLGTMCTFIVFRSDQAQAQMTQTRSDVIW